MRDIVNNNGGKSRCFVTFLVTMEIRSRQNRDFCDKFLSLAHNEKICAQTDDCPFEYNILQLPVYNILP